MLHEERWTFVLTNLDFEMNRRILQIETEMMKTLMNTHLNDDEKKEIIREKTFIFTSWVINSYIFLITTFRIKYLQIDAGISVQSFFTQCGKRLHHKDI